jgi:DNA-binding transcriptional ArsR family regulator
VANKPALDRTFAACSHPIRRQIVERLAGREMTVGEATSDFGGVAKPAISRHLHVPEDAGAIVRVIDGRNRRLRLSGNALEDAGA